MTNIQIRWCQEEDWGELGRIHCLSYHSTYKSIMPEDYLKTITINERQQFYRNILKKGRMNTAILIEEDTALGLLRISELEENRIVIEELYLLEDCRGKGFGTTFLLWIEEELIRRSGRTLELWVLQENLRAIKFYQRYGFERTGEERVIVRGKELIQIQYIKRIRERI